MDKGLYKSGGQRNISFLSFKDLLLEPSVSLIDKLYVINHDLYYNKNGIAQNLTSGIVNYWDRTGTILSPINAGDNVNLGSGYLKTDLGLRDNNVLIPVPIGENFNNYDNLSIELITNGDFSSGNTNWTEGADWSIGSGKASITTGGTSELSQAAPPLILTESVIYVISFDIIDVSLLGAGGTVTPKLLGSVEVLGTPQSTEVSGTYTQNILSTSDSLLGLSFECDNAAGASISNISIKSVISFLTSDFSSNSIIGSLNELRKAIPYGQELYLALYPLSGRSIADKYSDGVYDFSIQVETPTLTSNTVYTIPAVNENANFVMDKGNQIINGNKTFKDNVHIIGNLEFGLSNYARFINISSVNGDGSTVTVSCVNPHYMSTNDIVIMSSWVGGSGTWDGRFSITYIDDYVFSYSSTGNGTATGGTTQYVIGINTEIVDVILAKNKCNDIVIENLSLNPVTINIGTTLGGNEISNSLVCSPGINHISVNQIFNTTTDQSIFISSTSWGTEYIDVHIQQTKIMV